MSFRRILRFTACILVLLTIQAATTGRTPDRNDAESSYPAGALRYLTDGNRGGTLSPYDDLVKRYADRIGMDWRLLSAIIWHESQYNAYAVSPVGAKGLMQIRDVAAEHYGYPADELFNPAMNLRVGTLLLDDLMRSFRREALDSADVIRFVLASYNSGGGALSRRREEAVEAGLDPNKWEDVAAAYRLVDNSTTPAYIDAVEATYQRYCERYR